MRKILSVQLREDTGVGATYMKRWSCMFDKGNTNQISLSYWPTSQRAVILSAKEIWEARPTASR